MVNGATQVLFEGVPTYPDASRAWDIVDKYKVSSSHLSMHSALVRHDNLKVVVWSSSPG